MYCSARQLTALIPCPVPIVPAANKYPPYSTFFDTPSGASASHRHPAKERNIARAMCRPRSRTLSELYAREMEKKRPMAEEGACMPFWGVSVLSFSSLEPWLQARGKGPEEGGDVGVQEWQGRSCGGEV